MLERRKLADLLIGSERDALSTEWAEAKAANEFAPMPAGIYECEITDGFLFESTKGTPGYKLIFTVVDGPHAGRRLFFDAWLTSAAMSYTKRDLQKLGITGLDQLNRRPPEGIVCKVRVALKRDDDGGERSIVTKFDVVRIEPPPVDPFAPEASTEDDAEGAPPF